MLSLARLSRQSNAAFAVLQKSFGYWVHGRPFFGLARIGYATNYPVPPLRSHLTNGQFVIDANFMPFVIRISRQITQEESVKQVFEFRDGDM